MVFIESMEWQMNDFYLRICRLNRMAQLHFGRACNARGMNGCLLRSNSVNWIPFRFQMNVKYSVYYLQRTTTYVVVCAHAHAVCTTANHFHLYFYFFSKYSFFVRLLQTWIGASAFSCTACSAQYWLCTLNACNQSDFFLF